MPKTLILMRHAKAVPEGSEQEDHHRPLAEIGRNDANAIGRQLLKLNIRPQHALVSTSRRTQETISGVSGIVSISNIEALESLYLATPNGILQEIANIPNDVQTLIVVGHNPGIADLATVLTVPLQRPTINASKFLPATTAILEWPYADWKFHQRWGVCRLVYLLRASVPA